MHIVTTLDDIRAERELREKRAARRASSMPRDDYYADGNTVRQSPTGEIIHRCESHWDACLVLLALPDA